MPPFVEKKRELDLDYAGLTASVSRGIDALCNFPYCRSHRGRRAGEHSREITPMLAEHVLRIPAIPQRTSN